MECLKSLLCIRPPATRSQRDNAEDAPSSLTLKRCAYKAAAIVGNQNVQAVAGGIIVYGLATWWVGGSGLVIAAIGASVWLVSTVIGAALNVNYVIDSDRNRSDRSDTRGATSQPARVLFKSITCSIGLATPVGWIVVGFMDIAWACEHIQTYGCCCASAREDPDLSRSAIPDHNFFKLIQDKYGNLTHYITTDGHLVEYT